jgi:hypothetical protein
VLSVALAAVALVAPGHNVDAKCVTHGQYPVATVPGRPLRWNAMRDRQHNGRVVFDGVRLHNGSRAPVVAVFTCA